MTPNDNNTPDNELAELREQLRAKDEEISKLRELVSDQWRAEAEANSAEPGDEPDDERGDITLADILANPEVTKAVNTAVDAWANTQPDAMRLRFRSLHLGMAFSALVLLVIAALGYVGVLTRKLPALYSVRCLVTGMALGSRKTRVDTGAYNNSLDRSGGSVFCIMTGPAKLE